MMETTASRTPTAASPGAGDRLNRESCQGHADHPAPASVPTDARPTYPNRPRAAVLASQKRPKKDQSGKRPGEFGNTPARAIPDFMGIPDHPEPTPNDRDQGVNGDRRELPQTAPALVAR